MPYRFNPFTGEPDIVSDTSGFASQFNADSGSAAPSGGQLNLLGGTGINTDASGMTVNINLDVPVLQVNGGTGFTSYTDGQLLIGNSNDSGLDQATLTAGTGITITNGNGSITIDADNNGDVVGPVSSTNGNIVLFDGSTGKQIQDGGVGLPTSDGQLIIGDTGNPAQLGTLTGGTGLTVTNGAGSITIDLDTPVSVANGGTGATTLTDGGILLGSGTAAITVTSQPTNGQLLIGSTGVDPVLANLTGGTGITITNGAGSITIDADNSGDVSGPASSNDGNFAFFDGTTGKLLQDLGIDFTDFTSFNVTLEPSSGSYSTLTVNEQSNYMKIGRIVIFNIRIDVTGFSLGTASGALRITGLPFTSANIINNPFSGHAMGILENITFPASTSFITPSVIVNTDFIEFKASRDGSTIQNVAADAISGATFIYCSGFYFSAS